MGSITLLQALRAPRPTPTLWRAGTGRWWVSCRRRVALGCTALAVVLLGGCETTPAKLPEPAADREAAWTARQAALSQVQHWESGGKLAVRTEDDGWSATIRWTQDARDYRIRLSGPLGQGAVELVGGSAGVLMRTSQGETRWAPTPQALLYRNTGWLVPVTGLRHWILGIPSPDVPLDGLSLDPYGRPATLEQSGWLVEYQSYHAEPPRALETRPDAGAVREPWTQPLPKRIQLTRADVVAKLLVKDWRVSIGPIGE